VDFVIQWLCYLVAVVVGSAVARLIAVATVKRTSESEAPADLTDARESGAQ
jgi:uncharacterized membrane protein ArfB